MKPRSNLAIAPLGLALLACSSPQSGDGPPTTGTAAPEATQAPEAETAAPTAAETAPTATATATGAPSAKAEPDVTVPAGSADYSAALADAKAYKRGEIKFDELQKRVLARKLPPHKLGDGYLFMRPPPPPPGIVFNPLLMPDDWKGTWGEIAMTLFAGQITQDEYEKLHKAAHPACK